MIQHDRSEIEGEGAGVPAVADQDVPYDFKLRVNNLLKQKFGDKFERIAAEQPQIIAQLVAAAWQSSAGDNYRFAADPTSPADQIPVNWSAQVNSLIQSTITNPGTSDDPNAVSMYVALKDQYGVPRTSTETNFNASLQVPVPNPFGGQTAVSGYDYGVPSPTSFPDGRVGYAGGVHLGVDYGTTAGSPIVSPFAGTVEFLQDQPGYGNLMIVQLDDGSQFRLGHVADSAGLVSGMRVNPGDVIATAGANIGSAQGSVTLVEWKDAQGNFQNPHDILDPIQQGTTYQKLGLTLSAVGQGLSKTQIQDMRLGIFDTGLERVYSGAVKLWNDYFGRKPTTAQLQEILAHGGDPTAWEDYIRSLPKPSIPGMTIGQYADARKLADAESGAIYGHPSNDAIVKEMFNAGAHSAADVKAFYLHLGFQPGKDVDAATYTAIYQANLPHTQGLYNAQPDPRTLKQQHEAAGGAPATTTQAAAAAEALGAAPAEPTPVGANGGGHPSMDA